MYLKHPTCMLLEDYCMTRIVEFYYQDISNFIINPNKSIGHIQSVKITIILTVQVGYFYCHNPNVFTDASNQNPER